MMTCFVHSPALLVYMFLDVFVSVLFFVRKIDVTTQRKKHQTNKKNINLFILGSILYKKLLRKKLLDITISNVKK